MPASRSAIRDDRPLALICACDEAYAMPTAVMLASVAAHADPDRIVNVHLVAHGLAPETLERLGAVLSPTMRLRLVDGVRLGRLPETHWGHVSTVTYDRLFAGSLAGDDRLLWLDSDLLVLDDVSRLFDHPLGGGTLGAVPDPFVRSLGSPWGIQHRQQRASELRAAYFNAGVMLIDGAVWRRARVAERAMAYLAAAGPRVIFWDQEALNAVLARAWTPLPERWNRMFNPMHARRQDCPDEDAAIVHFAGSVKPWSQIGLGPLQERWFHYLDCTPWRGRRPPAGPRERLLGTYLTSPLRRLTYPLENLRLRLHHRRQVQRAGAPS